MDDQTMAYRWGFLVGIGEGIVHLHVSLAQTFGQDTTSENLFATSRLLRFFSTNTPTACSLPRHAGLLLICIYYLNQNA